MPDLGEGFRDFGIRPADLTRPGNLNFLRPSTDGFNSAMSATVGTVVPSSFMAGQNTAPYLAPDAVVTASRPNGFQLLNSYEEGFLADKADDIAYFGQAAVEEAADADFTAEVLAGVEDAAELALLA